MSVVILVPDMKKADECGTCDFSLQHPKGALTCPFCAMYVEECRVKELPKTHGRLKDVDRIIALSKEAFNELASASLLRPYVTVSEAIELLVSVLDDDDAAPTIIEAEGPTGEY